MSAAAFVLAINLFVAGLFAIAFGILAAYQRTSVGARWIALGYGFGIVNSVLEFLLPFQSDARFLSFVIFVAFLLALTSITIGVAHHYRLKLPTWGMAGLLIGSMLVNLLILDMDRASILRGMLYQAPYALMMLAGLVLMMRLPQRRPLDIVLMVILLIVSLHFLAKPILAHFIGSGGSAQGYLTSTYAAIAQSVGAVLHISTGLMLLLIMVRDAMAEIIATSETDKLSGLHNRRGFEDRGREAMALCHRAGVPAVMIMADLDHFKQINDNYGHAAGDKVISAFAAALRRAADDKFVLGRTGGEEFAIFMPGATVANAEAYAEAARQAFAGNDELFFNGKRPTASFGVTLMEPGDALSDLIGRADRALYTAKAQGRNRVVVGTGKAPTLIARDGVLTKSATGRH